MAGAGCPSCAKTGFQGVTGIFEVLPFTDPVRAAVAAGGVEGRYRGGRCAPPACVRSSPPAPRESRPARSAAEELDRVLRFSGA